ncbi:MAG: hypothetical protein NC548_44610 [Lachnospiraceae bacterium]|nr:hypothetical protein [Lachnospiraceae bacterium]
MGRHDRVRRCEICGREFAFYNGLQKNCKDCASVLRTKHLATYNRIRRGGRQARASGLSYDNSPERLRAIREKYKNGIPDGEIEAWICGAGK